jgi:chromosome segregation ATPase
VAALGTAEERAQWARIAALEEQVAALPPGLERDEAADKLRLIKGVLYWRLDAAFKERSYDQRRALRELDAALEELQNRWVRVQRARATVPTNTGEFAERIAALAARIKAVRERLADTSGSRAIICRTWLHPSWRAEGAAGGLRGAGALCAGRHLRPRGRPGR